MCALFALVRKSMMVATMGVVHEGRRMYAAVVLGMMYACMLQLCVSVFVCVAAT